MNEGKSAILGPLGQRSKQFGFSKLERESQ